MAMKNPPHPGLAVKYDCLEPLELNITKGAKILDVTRQTLNDLVNGHRGISPEMALRLDMAFGGGADTWLRLQTAYDLAQAKEKAKKINVRRYNPSQAQGTAKKGSFKKGLHTKGKEKKIYEAA
jgi:antitoxin HigA-1